MKPSEKIFSYLNYKIIKTEKESAEAAIEGNAGILYVISTPIGNLGDMTLRAIEVLSNVDIIACEDTRHSYKLLKGLKSFGKIVSYHKFNEKKRTPELIKLLKEGRNIAIISNAGSPCISDPGLILIQRAIEEGIKIDYVPGANSILPALVLSGFPTSPFMFGGFIPSKEKERNKILFRFKNFCGTIIFFESPHRLKKSLMAIYDLFENPEICIAKELTKLHQQILRGKADYLLEKIQDLKYKGEYIIIINNSHHKNLAEAQIEIDLRKEYEELLQKGFSRKEAIKLLAEIFACSKREIYRKIIK